MEKTVVCFLALSVSLGSVACVFVHEPSAILLKPGGDANPLRDFGFSMGHLDEQLIVGSPRSNLMGEVYSCPIAAVTDNTDIICSSLDLNASSTKHMIRTFQPNQNFYLGASISTTKEYFLTCAPLMTKELKKYRKTLRDAIGTCYIYFRNNTVIPYKGPDYRYNTGKNRNETRIEGGYGWTTLADEVNGILITSKSAVIGDINYSPISDFRSAPISYAIFNQSEFEIHTNIGYGLAAGTFFSNTTVCYAFSAQNINMKGEILFLELKGSRLLMMPNRITHQSVNAMFGYTLAAADLTLDGLSELLVGAPAQSDDGAAIEYGALHIYKGGDAKSCNEKNRIRSISGEAGQGRFGTAIAVGDIDGDKIPEVFVSAPYEGTGVVYVLSGFELKMLLSSSTYMQKRVSELQLTQRVLRRDVRLFGFSLLMVPDLNGNGFNELAIGAPGEASVFLYRGLQHVNVTISSHVVGSQFVKERDTNFTVSVCLSFDYRSSLTNVTGSISAINYINGENVYIDNPRFKISLAERPTNSCSAVIVQMTKYEDSVSYKFITKLELLDLSTTLNSKDFNNSLVVLSPYNETEYTLDIERRCVGKECVPDLKMIFHGPTDNYTLGSSKAETVTITVVNHGFMAQKACVWLRLTGALVTRAGCEPKAGGLQCLLQTIGRDDERNIKIVLNTTKLSNEDTELNIFARLYENCDQDKNTIESFNMPYNLELEKDLVHLGGTTRVLEFTEKDIITDKKVATFKHQHGYSITNNGSITWKNIRATILIDKKPFIVEVASSSENCSTRFDDNDQKFKVNCNMNLADGDISQIIVWVEMSKKEVEKCLKETKEINEMSKMILYLDPTGHEIYKELEIKIKWKTDVTFGTNKLLMTLVAGILALILLAIIFVILLKNGFFKRKEKKRLDVLRESVRRRSVRLGSERRQSRHPDSVADDEFRHRSERKQSQHPESLAGDLLVDVQEMVDSAFEDPVGKSDGVVLTESQAEVHSSEERKNK